MGTPLPPPTPPSTASPGPAPRDPPLECDLVMKGGITSGVVYPLAVCELATVYRLRCVGGSSAGAIAAAAAACAELGRADGGFERLAALPRDLTATVSGGESRLFTLFQPQPTMRRLFALLTSGLGTAGLARTRAVARTALTAWIGYAALGALLGLACIVAGFLLGGAAAWLTLVTGLVLVVVGAIAGVAYGALRDVRRIPESGFGLCSGHTAPDDPMPALTSWLHEVFQTLAGRTVDDDPITFGELSEAGVTLQLMTTNLCRHEPVAMPWETGEFHFDPARFRQLFPERVVARMEAARPAAGGEPTVGAWMSAVARLQAAPLRPFPAAADLPILVGVRMSLSFPGLIAAVPLQAVDFNREENRHRRAVAREWHREHPGATPEEAAGVLERFSMLTNWFSDGGICANLPLHFFDSTLPRRPTFAIDLASFPTDRKKSPYEQDNSYLPTSNDAGLLRRQVALSEHGLGGLVGFFSTIVDTARTWVDESHLSMPGYRDRIVTVYTDADEGGLNLNMPPAVVAGLSERGRGAAARLTDRFAGDRPGVVATEGWDNHRWLRFRTATAALSEMLGSFRSGFTTTLPGTTPYDAWVGLRGPEDHTGPEGPLPSYAMTKARREAANRRTQGLLETAAQWQRDPADAFTHDAPQPRPTWRLVPSEKGDDVRPG